MSLVVLTMPDDPLLLAAWLEQQLVGDRLGDLVAELSAVHGGHSGEPLTLNEVLGTEQGAVCREGLSALRPEQVRQLLQHPRLLLELQTLVFLEGGEHWTRIPPSPAIVDKTSRQWKTLVTSIEEPAVTPNVDRGSRRPHPIGVMIATAASVLLVVLMVDQFRPPRDVPPGPSVATTSWGWIKPDALSSPVDAKGYFASLADGGQEWFDRRPNDAVGLARRLGELREGCSVLQVADHPALSDTQRTWLRTRCRQWAGQLDEIIEKLETGSPPAAVRQEVDAIVTAMVAELRKQSSQA